MKHSKIIAFCLFLFLCYLIYEDINKIEPFSIGAPDGTRAPDGTPIELSAAEIQTARFFGWDVKEHTQSLTPEEVKSMTDPEKLIDALAMRGIHGYDGSNFVTLPDGTREKARKTDPQQRIKNLQDLLNKNLTMHTGTFYFSSVLPRAGKKVIYELPNIPPKPAPGWLPSDSLKKNWFLPPDYNLLTNPQIMKLIENSGDGNHVGWPLKPSTELGNYVKKVPNTFAQLLGSDEAYQWALKNPLSKIQPPPGSQMTSAQVSAAVKKQKEAQMAADIAAAVKIQAAARRKAAQRKAAQRKAAAPSPWTTHKNINTPEDISREWKAASPADKHGGILINMDVKLEGPPTPHGVFDAIPGAKYNVIDRDMYAAITAPVKAKIAAGTVPDPAEVKIPKGSYIFHYIEGTTEKAMIISPDGNKLLLCVNETELSTTLYNITTWRSDAPKPQVPHITNGQVPRQNMRVKSAISSGYNSIEIVGDEMITRGAGAAHDTLVTKVITNARNPVNALLNIDVKDAIHSAKVAGSAKWDKLENLPIVQTGTPTQQERVLIGSSKPGYLDMSKQDKVLGTITLPEMTFTGLDDVTYTVKAGSRWLPSPDSRIMMLDDVTGRTVFIDPIEAGLLGGNVHDYMGIPSELDKYKTKRKSATDRLLADYQQQKQDTRKGDQVLDALYQKDKHLATSNFQRQLKTNLTNLEIVSREGVVKIVDNPGIFYKSLLESTHGDALRYLPEVDKKDPDLIKVALNQVTWQFPPRSFPRGTPREQIIRYQKKRENKIAKARQKLLITSLPDYFQYETTTDRKTGKITKIGKVVKRPGPLTTTTGAASWAVTRVVQAWRMSDIELEKERRRERLAAELSNILRMVNTPC